MNKIDKLLDKAAKFEKLAKNVKLGQYNPSTLSEIVNQIKTLKAEVASKVGSKVSGDPELQKSFGNFIYNQNMASSGILLNMFISELKTKPQFSSIYSSLLGDVVEMQKLSNNFLSSSSEQVNRLPNDKTINIEDLPDAPGSKSSKSLGELVDSKVMALKGQTSKVRELELPWKKSTITDFDMQASKVDYLVGQLLSDKKKLEDGVGHNLNGELAMAKSNNITSAVKSAVDTVLDVGQKLFNTKWQFKTDVSQMASR